MARVMAMRIHIHAHRTVDHPITVETTHVVQVKTVIVAHRIVDPVHQPIHVQTLTTFSLERHVSMLKWLLSVLALLRLHRLLHKHLHKLLVDQHPRPIHLLPQILVLGHLPKHIHIVRLGRLHPHHQVKDVHKKYVLRKLYLALLSM